MDGWTSFEAIQVHAMNRKEGSSFTALVFALHGDTAVSFMYFSSCMIGWLVGCIT